MGTFITEEDGLQRFPSPSEVDFYLPKGIVAQLTMIAEKSSRGEISNVLIKGQQGCGKTQLIRQFASVLKRPYVCIEIGLLEEAGEVFGQQTLDNGEIVWRNYRLSDAVRTRGLIAHLDEINRADRPEALNPLISCLDDRRSIYVEASGEAIDVAPGVVFFATINEGLEFTGTKELDSALRDRFFTINLTYPPLEVEVELFQSRLGLDKETAESVAGVCRQARQNGVDVSTRKALQIAECRKFGLSWSRALEFSIGADRGQVEQVLVKQHLEGEQLEDLSTEWVLF